MTRMGIYHIREIGVIRAQAETGLTESDWFSWSKR